MFYIDSTFLPPEKDGIVRSVEQRHPNQKEALSVNFPDGRRICIPIREDPSFIDGQGIPSRSNPDDIITLISEISPVLELKSGSNTQPRFQQVSLDEDSVITLEDIVNLNIQVFDHNHKFKDVTQLPHYYIPEKNVRKSPKCKDETDQILVDYGSAEQRAKLKLSEN